MLVSDAGAALSSIFLLVMLALGELQLWQVYLATVLNAACQAFQWPAAAAAVPLLVPRRSWVGPTG